MTNISAELVRRCELYAMPGTTTAVCQALGVAVDAGLIELPALLDLVRSCNNTDELGDALVILAASAQLQPAGGAR